MKVFGCYREGFYSGGMVLVAADTKEDAFHTWLNDKRFDWMHEQDNEGNYIDCYYYPFLKWFECEELNASVERPKVLYECGYSE